MQTIVNVGWLVTVSLGFLGFGVALSGLAALLEWAVERRMRRLRDPVARLPGRSSPPRT